MHVVRGTWSRQSLVEFNIRLKETADAEKRMRKTSSKPQTKDVAKSKQVTKLLTSNKRFDRAHFHHAWLLGVKLCMEKNFALLLSMVIINLKIVPKQENVQIFNVTALIMCCCSAQSGCFLRENKNNEQQTPTVRLLAPTWKMHVRQLQTRNIF